MTPKEYDALVRQLSPSSPIGKDTALAFVVGGGICAVMQGTTYSKTESDTVSYS